MEEKFFQLGTYSESQWDTLNLELVSTATTSNFVPQRAVICVDELMHSATRGTYLLTQDEADALKNDPRVKWINIDYKSYPETYQPPPDELHCVPVAAVNRWASAKKGIRTPSGLPSPATNADANRMGYGVIRHRQFAETWKQSAVSPDTTISTNVSVYGTGKHVDVIVADDGGGWHGHPEFYNDPISTVDQSEIEKPNGYAGGNRLPGNGKCDVLDLVLDAPYYLDPEWFDLSPGTRLITRWDGTKVPVESFARAWWDDTSQRSPAFAAFGNVNIGSSYTRQICNGSNTVKPPDAIGIHATPCMALTFGRTQGWAYNSNKWSFNFYGQNSTGFEQGFDIVKIFHQAKPINPLYGNKNPTIMSNSWGFRANKDPDGSTWYYTHRSTINTPYNSESGIPWLSHMGETGDIGRWKSEMKPNSYTTALDELIAAGVIVVVAAGNSNQKQVVSSHPDYNNYVTTTNGGSLINSAFTEFGVDVYGTVNRRGFPQQGGAYVDGSGNRVYPVINIGALDDTFRDNKELKAYYSDRGNDIDAYFAGDQTLAANHAYGSDFYVGPRADTYTGLTQPATDVGFRGTSAACPGATGFIACILEYNRTWGWQDVKSWLATLTVPSNSDFYYGAESTTPIDGNWNDYESLEGGSPKVLYQTPDYYNDNLAGPVAGFSRKPAIINEGGGADGFFDVMTAKVPTNTLIYWTILHATTAGLDFSSPSGTILIENDRGGFAIDPVADLLTEGVETFQIQLRLNSTSGTVIGTSGTVSIGDTSLGQGGATYAVSGYAGTIIEGGNTTVTVTTTAVSNGTTLYWTINHSSTTAADFVAQEGAFTINSDTGSFVITTRVT